MRIWHMMTTSNGNIFRVKGPLCGKFTGPRWIPRTKASDAELWCFLWSASEQMIDYTSRCRWFGTPSRSSWCHCNECKWNQNIHSKVLYSLPQHWWLPVFGSSTKIELFHLPPTATIQCGTVLYQEDMKDGSQSSVAKVMAIAKWYHIYLCILWWPQ